MIEILTEDVTQFLLSFDKKFINSIPVLTIQTQYILSEDFLVVLGDSGLYSSDFNVTKGCKVPLHILKVRW